MKQTINVTSVTKKTSKTGAEFFVVETKEGNMTAWDENIAKSLMASVGKSIMAEIQQNGDFKNIRKVEGAETVEGEINIPSAPVNNNYNKFAGAKVDKTKSILTSYAKDLIIAGKEEKEAVELVKRLMESF
jgi:hypothetical protein